MTTPSAAYQQGASYSAAADRDLLTSLVYRKLVGDESLAVDGVLYGGPIGNLADYAPSGWTTTVERGRAIVGGYVVAVPKSITLSHDVATTSARRDLVILRVRDTEQGDAENSAKVEIVKGTTTADPVVPLRSLVLSAVTIRASSSSIVATDIVDRRVFTAANGGVITTGDLNNTPNRPASAPQGALIYDYLHDTHHRKTAAGAYVPLAPFPHAIFYSTNYRVSEAGMAGPGALSRHALSLGDASFVSVTNVEKLTVHPTALYIIDWHWSCSAYQVGSGYLSITWPGMPAAIAVLIGGQNGALSTTILITAETEIAFNVRSLTGSDPLTSSVITVTRMS